MFINCDNLKFKLKLNLLQLTYSLCQVLPDNQTWQWQSPSMPLKRGGLLGKSVAYNGGFSISTLDSRILHYILIND